MKRSLNPSRTVGKKKIKHKYTRQTFFGFLVLGEYSDSRVTKSSNMLRRFRFLIIKCLACGTVTQEFADDLVRGRLKDKCLTCHPFAAVRKAKNGNEGYKSWQMMKSRCHNVTYDDYSNYGGRGIKVCEEWIRSYESFRQWAIANGWQEGLTLERKDPNGNYEPNNCCWITRSEQQYNKRNTKKLTYNGITKPVAIWSKEIGVPSRTILKRLSSGWDIDRVMTTPLLNNGGSTSLKHKRLECKGEPMTISSFAKKFGFSEGTVRYKIKNGKSLDDILQERLNDGTI